MSKIFLHIYSVQERKRKNQIIAKLNRNDEHTDITSGAAFREAVEKGTHWY